jgi:hypothetical protein
MINGRIVVAWQHALVFYDQGGNVLEEVDFESEEALDKAMEALEDKDHPLWPTQAVRVADKVTAVTRPAIRGVDYGPGSQKHRFGGARVPRSAYQYKKE